MQVVRLGKFWYKSLYLGPKPIYGVKTILELIAVSAAMEEQATYATPFLTKAFNKFLDGVRRIDKLGLAFKKNRNGYWELSQLRGCAIIEPANPYNDLSKNFAKREVELDNLKKFAMITHGRISQAILSNQCSGREIFEIFRPLPKICEGFRAINPPQIIEGPNLDTSYRSLVPSMIINNPKLFERGPFMNDILRVIQATLSTAVSSSVSSVAVRGEVSSSVSSVAVRGEVSSSVSSVAVLGENPEDTVKKVQPMINRMLTEDVCGREYSPWVPAELRHEDCDVTFKIPISTERKLGALKYSFKWD